MGARYAIAVRFRFMTVGSTLLGNGSSPFFQMLRSRSTLDSSKRSLPCQKQNNSDRGVSPVGNRKMEDMGMTNEDRLSNVSTEEKAVILTKLFYEVAQYSNAIYYIKKWLKETVKE